MTWADSHSPQLAVGYLPPKLARAGVWLKSLRSILYDRKGSIYHAVGE